MNAYYPSKEVCLKLGIKRVVVREWYYEGRGLLKVRRGSNVYNVRTSVFAVSREGAVFKLRLLINKVDPSRVFHV